MPRETKTLFAVAVAGFCFLAVAIVGAVVTLVQIGSAVSVGWTLALPGVAAGALATVAGGAGYVLAREHSRAVLEREGLLLELEAEFDALRADDARLGDAHGRLLERARLDGETVKEAVKESRLAVDRALTIIELQKQKIEALELRVSELETALGPKAPSVRVGVTR